MCCIAMQGLGSLIHSGFHVADAVLLPQERRPFGWVELCKGWLLQWVAAQLTAPMHTPPHKHRPTRPTWQPWPCQRATFWPSSCGGQLLPA